MDFKSYVIKNVFMPFFVIVSCACAVIAVIGMVYQPDARFGYGVLFSPLIFGAATTLPSLVNYSRRELSIREALMRKLIQLVLIEAIVLLIIHMGGGLSSVAIGISVSLSVLMVFAAVHLVRWIDDQKTARELTRVLKEAQGTHPKGD